MSEIRILSTAEVSKLVQRELDSSLTNFPVKCFYNESDKEIYSFYKEGDTFVIKANDLEDYVYQKICNIGQAALFLSNALIIQSSFKIKFFKLTYDEDLEITQWKQYHQIKNSS